jgi:hypothetical protein
MHMAKNRNQKCDTAPSSHLSSISHFCESCNYYHINRKLPCGFPDHNSINAIKTDSHSYRILNSKWPTFSTPSPDTGKGSTFLDCPPLPVFNPFYVNLLVASHAVAVWVSRSSQIRSWESLQFQNASI